MGHQPSKEQPSKESARLAEISEERFKVSQQLDTLQALAAAEAAAGTPAAEGRHQARWETAWGYYLQLCDESTAIIAYRMAQREGRSLPMPDRTPPVCMPPLPEPEAQVVAPEPASAVEEEPGTPLGSTSFPGGQRGGSNGSEEGAQANLAEGSSEGMPLLAGGSGGLAAGLRRRQGHQESG
ncbi:hypothetical protein COHA_001477 [Chlorella ohadii]|uniref:Uncharacterized protein n=1 Tax=Chlorella ohadii TaxID=2649997 RepID=A0AAD5DWU5_9CHLO|nr:hypothetical protein COHA_001477 [Chlorella ohadii]